jgi:competence protein ComEA
MPAEADPVARLAAVARATARDAGPATGADDPQVPAQRDHPPSWPRPMPPRVVTAALLAAGIAVAALLIRGLLSDAGAVVASVPSAPRASRSGTLPTVSTVPTGVAVASPPAGEVVVVHVVGRVRRPGLVTLPAGARLGDAVAAAGGAAPGAAPDRLNLARHVADGERVVVPGPNDVLSPAAAGPATAGSLPSDASAGGGLIDLNSATQPQLEELPGIGPVTAAAILAWRTEHQRFTRVEELGEVDGIGPKTLARLRPLVRV